jgi:hypothetical protein
VYTWKKVVLLIICCSLTARKSWSEATTTAVGFCWII